MGIVFVRTSILYFSIILALRLMGKRQMGELAPTEFVITLLIAEVAAVPMQSNEIPMVYGLISIGTLISLEILLSILSLKLPSLNTLISGKPSIIVENGTILQDEMARQCFTLSDLCEELRMQKINRISDISYAILETNGRLSVFLKPQCSPVTREEAGIRTKDLGLVRLLVNDGKVQKAVCQELCLTKPRLEELLSRHGLTVENTYYCSVDQNGEILELIKKEPVS